jgi:hypothetical protein
VTCHGTPKEDSRIVIFVWQLLASLAGQLNSLRFLGDLGVSAVEVENITARDAENAEGAQRVEIWPTPNRVSTVNHGSAIYTR